VNCMNRFVGMSFGVVHALAASMAMTECCINIVNVSLYISVMRMATVLVVYMAFIYVLMCVFMANMPAVFSMRMPIDRCVSLLMSYMPTTRTMYVIFMAMCLLMNMHWGWHMIFRVIYVGVCVVMVTTHFAGMIRQGLRYW